MALTEADVVREQAWLDLEAESLLDPAEGGVSDREFEEEIALAAQGRWAELGLDDLPEGFQWEPPTPADLREDMQAPEALNQIDWAPISIDAMRHVG